MGDLCDHAQSCSEVVRCYLTEADLFQIEAALESMIARRMRTLHLEHGYTPTELRASCLALRHVIHAQTDDPRSRARRRRAAAKRIRGRRR